MKRVIAAFVLAVTPLVALGAASSYPLDKAKVDLSDQASLQRGAKLFVNYCLSCHSAQYQRYNRMGSDLGLTDDQVKENLMLAGDKIGDTMTIAMSMRDGAKWFGAPPPDLSVIARSRGSDWLYTYLKTFYADERRPFGVNNAVFADVGMPHVMWDLEGGIKQAIWETKVDGAGNQSKTIVGFNPPISSEFDQSMRDLTAYLTYMGEPIAQERKRIGMWVLGFLGIFFIFAYWLKKEYWRDIH
jgi:ubiquinol-cytochrome c reductase cytochrome c1 subunit